MTVSKQIQAPPAIFNPKLYVDPRNPEFAQKFYSNLKNALLELPASNAEVVKLAELISELDSHINYTDVPKDKEIIVDEDRELYNALTKYHTAVVKKSGNSTVLKQVKYYKTLNRLGHYSGELLTFCDDEGDKLIFDIYKQLVVVAKAVS